MMLVLDLIRMDYISLKILESLSKDEIVFNMGGS
jgi:hypothetical protein